MLYEAINIIYGIALEQGMRIPPGVKVLSALWLLFIINLGTGYKSNLVSYLSIPVKETIPRNVQQLAERRDFRVLVNNLGAVEKAFFEHSDLELVKKIKSLVDWEPNTESCVTSALLNKSEVCMGWDQFVLLTAASTFTIQPQATEPLLFQSNDGVLEVYLTLGFRKDFKYQDHFRLISYAFYESGIFTKWEKEVYYIFKLRGVNRMAKERREKSNVFKIVWNYVQNGDNKIHSLKIDNLKVAFLILGVGLLFATFIYSTEKLSIYMS